MGGHLCSHLKAKGDKLIAQQSSNKFDSNFQQKYVTEGLKQNDSYLALD